MSPPSIQAALSQKESSVTSVKPRDIFSNPPRRLGTQSGEESVTVKSRRKSTTANSKLEPLSHKVASVEDYEPAVLRTSKVIDRKTKL